LEFFLEERFELKYAIVNNDRTLSQPRTKGSCPVCNKEVVSKCGNKIVWHWAHSSQKHCDSWWEPETQWHRDWKGLYPNAWQEVVQFDATSGEKHIADVKTNTGLVIEFQNSPLKSEELRQREVFHKKIVWVVNGEKFKNNFNILHGLPDPKCKFLEDILFFPKIKGFYKRSEDRGGASLVEVHSFREIQEEIDKGYRGHHLFDWVRPRTVWYESSVPVFIDFGDEFLWNLQIYDDRGLRCVQVVSKLKFLKDTAF
jgi:ssDNA-binding Zn-finger/Zn-ribbon topoisomerase 1